MELPLAPGLMVGAACSLDAHDLRERLAAWRGLRESALAIEIADDAIRLTFAVDQPVAEVEHLVALESACCPFYRFTIQVDGANRVLEVEAGPNGMPAVRALLGLPG